MTALNCPFSTQERTRLADLPGPARKIWIAEALFGELWWAKTSFGRTSCALPPTGLAVWGALGGHSNMRNTRDFLLLTPALPDTPTSDAAARCRGPRLPIYPSHDKLCSARGMDEFVTFGPSWLFQRPS